MHVHMRKAGGTTLRQAILESCGLHNQFRNTVTIDKVGGQVRNTSTPTWVAREGAMRLHESEWTLGLPPLIKRQLFVTSIRHPMSRLVSSYLFEGGAQQCWGHDSEQVLRRCLLRLRHPLAPFASYVNASRQQQSLAWEMQREPGAATSKQDWHRGLCSNGCRLYLANYYVRRLLWHDENATRACGVSVHDRATPCHAAHAFDLLQREFALVVLFEGRAFSSATVTSQQPQKPQKQHISTSSALSQKPHASTSRVRAVTHGLLPCCVASIEWARVAPWSAEGFLHRTDREDTAELDRLIEHRSAELRAQIQSADSSLWASLLAENEADLTLWRMLREAADRLGECK